MKKQILYITIFISLGLFSCSEEKLGPSIFENSSWPQNELDEWIQDSIRTQYNMIINYRWEDIESDMKYNLTPADYDKSFMLAKLMKYLWLDAYDELTGSRDFLSVYVPKLTQFVGSAAINPESHTEVLGTAEGGKKITLYNVNKVSLTNPDIDELNELFFKTMHHEFAHILHQNKNYPVSFNEISAGKYSSSGWQNWLTPASYWSLGFVTNYAGKEPQEDFVEIIANYVTNPQRWEQMMRNSATDTTSINRKFEIVKEWLDTSFDINIDSLQSIVQRRSSDFINVIY